MPATMRPARLDDRAAPRLLYVSAQPYYDAFTGGPGRALRVLERIWAKPGHTASHELCRVAVIDGEPVGALVAFRAEDGDALARRFLALALLRIPVWRWPVVVRHLRAAATVMPEAPEGALYVDALAVDAAARRRGVAGALIADAEQLASLRGLRGLALDTGLENHAARALYESHGFEAVGERPARNPRVAGLIGGTGFVSYFKPV